MAVNIDTVYQQVLAISNKEQRGYITPQEFNLMANKVQLEIFDSYFHDLKTAYHKVKNDIIYADESSMLIEKLQVFDSVIQDINGSSTLVVSGEQNQYNINNTVQSDNNDYNPVSIGILKLGTSLDNITGSSIPYKIKSVERDGKKVEEIKEENLLDILNNPLLAPNKNRSVYVRKYDATNGEYLQIYPKPIETSSGVFDTSSFTIRIWRKPRVVKWAYVVVNNQALYNANLSTNFKLHISEEKALVTRILQLSGITMNKPGLVEAAMTDTAQTKQSQNY